MKRYAELAPLLAKSEFRSRFKLGKAELRYLDGKSSGALRGHCEVFIRERLAPAVIPNDGRQTPWRGHPCFVAQHATGCCCRSCLEKWHGIPKGRALTEEEIAGIVTLLTEWIEAKNPRDFHTPDLFS